MKQVKFTVDDVYIDNEGFLRKMSGHQLIYGAPSKSEDDAAGELRDFLDRAFTVEVTVTIAEPETGSEKP